MRRSHGGRRSVIATGLLAALAVSAPMSGDAVVDAGVRPQSAGPPVATPQRAPQSMFGFRVGEERRYVLGPPEALVSGESGQWSIRLADISLNQGRPFAVIDLSFEAREFGGPNLSELHGRSLRARVIVNEVGFPGLLTVNERMNDITLTTTYTLQEDGTYRQVIGWPDNEYTFPVPLPTHRNLDVAGQRGLYLFVNGQNLRGALRSNFVNNLFANPGLLSLVLPQPLPDNDWEQEILAFAPTDAMPRYPEGNLLRALGDGNAARTSNFSRIRISTRGAQEIEIGGRTLEAIRLEVRGPFRRAFADRQGRMLLIEHESLDLRRPRHIRLLWPSEY